MTKITIHGEPRALQRHRTTIRSGVQKQYDPQAKQKVITRKYMWAEKLRENWPSGVDSVTWPFISENNMENLTSAYIRGFDLIINFYCYCRPCQRKLSEEDINKIPHTQKPDLDNMIKYILDCGNGILWHDDSEIYRIRAEKMWSRKPRTEIIWEFTGVQ